jgi:anti-sigma-K factor RskA
MNDDTPVDLSPLDPDADPARLERTARAVAARIAPTLRRRRERVPALWVLLAGWRRPVLAAAALVAVLAIATLVVPRSPVSASRMARSLTLTEAEGLPAPVAAWLEGGTPPSGDALLGLEETP